MQDRFKFRAWHKKRKKMYEVLHLHVGYYSYGGDWVTAKGFNIITQQDMHIQIQPEECLIVQCTGLKDKNGVNLLFEYDIINKDGIKIGNCYENEELLKDTTNFIIKGMGTKEWRSTEQEAIKRGCYYAE
ncbi:MAG: YopX family protein [Candidatus Gastranaerophilales bacterium]|nr:YopX family protein [Candidatus Gastranaerophilales bacterium]MCM1072249.1 YopX family protein [Bacteroides sp.]